LWTASARSIVVASATIQRSEPQTAAPGITWPTVVAILDSDGKHLTDVDVPGPPRGGRLLLGDVEEPAALLDYCFGYSDRQVMLVLRDVLIDGWLETRWEGGRRSWWLEPVAQGDVLADEGGGITVNEALPTDVT
jgi:hypothetical protein